MTGLWIALAAVGAVMVAVGFAAIAAAQGSRGEAPREREGRRDGYLFDADPCPDCAAADTRSRVGELAVLQAALAAKPGGREAIRRARHCPSCGVHAAGREQRDLCPARTCTIWSCPGCGARRGSAGPVGCVPCEGPPWWQRAASRITGMFGRRVS